MNAYNLLTAWIAIGVVIFCAVAVKLDWPRRSPAAIILFSFLCGPGVWVGVLFFFLFPKTGAPTVPPEVVPYCERELFIIAVKIALAEHHADDTETVLSDRCRGLCEGALRKAGCDIPGPQ